MHPHHRFIQRYPCYTIPSVYQHHPSLINQNPPGPDWVDEILNLIHDLQVPEMIEEVLQNRFPEISNYLQTCPAMNPPILATGAHPISLTYSPDGKELAIGTQDGVQIWDVQTRSLLRHLSSSSGVSAIAYSPNGKELATATHYDGVEIWDTQTWNLIQNLPLIQGRLSI